MGHWTAATILSSLLAIACTLPAQAQGATAGLLVSVNHTSLARNNVDGHVGGALGGTAGWELGGPLRFRFDGVITRRVVGHAIGGCPSFFPCTPEQILPPGTRSVRLTQVDVPVMLELRGRGGSIRPWAQAGGYGAARLGCRARDDHGAGATSFACGEDLRRFHAGLVGGAGLAVGPVGVGVRWTRSLTSLAGPPPVDGSSLFNATRLSTIALVVEVTDLFR